MGAQVIGTDTYSILLACFLLAPCTLSLLYTLPHTHRENLTTSEVQEEADESREAALRVGASDLSKFHVITLQAALSQRGMDANGLKSVLIERVRGMLHL